MAALVVDEDHPTLEVGGLLLRHGPLVVASHVVVALLDEVVKGIVVEGPNLPTDGVQSTLTEKHEVLQLL